MNYHVILDTHFAAYNDVSKLVQASAARGPLPAGFDISGISSIPVPFLRGGMLYVPLALGAAKGGGTFGFLVAKVTNVLDQSEEEVAPMPTEADLKKAGVKLAPQALKMLSKVANGSKMFTHDSYDGRGFRCRAEEIVKCIAYGYMSMQDSRQVVDDIGYCDYNMHHRISDKKTTLANAQKILIGSCQDPTYKGMSRSVGCRLSNWLFRTDKAVDETLVVKWRKPSKASSWPWTLDHHWFNVQESPVAMAYYMMSSLISKEHSSNKSSLLQKLPVFGSIKQLEQSRKLLDFYFKNLKELLKPHSHQMAEFSNMAQDIEWPGSTRYGGCRKPSAEVMPIKACLATGVLPAFNQSGDFEKFVPINGKLHSPDKKVYVEATAESVSGRRAELGILMAYSVGIIDLRTLEALIGPSVVSCADRLKADPQLLQLNVGENVVCCVPLDSGCQATYDNLKKYGINLLPKCAQAPAAQALEEAEEDISEQDPDELVDSLEEEEMDREFTF